MKIKLVQWDGVEGGDEVEKNKKYEGGVKIDE
jgi:hypothetical protein